MEGAFYLTCLGVNDYKSVWFITDIVCGVNIVTVSDEDLVCRNKFAAAIRLDDIYVLAVDFHDNTITVSGHIFHDTTVNHSHGVANYIVRIGLLADEVLY